MKQTKMKKTILIMILTLVLVLSATSFVLAEDDQATDSNEITPALISENPAESIPQETESNLGLNESASDGKIAWKQVKLWFTFNQEKKIEGELELAKLRLIQAKNAAKNNNSEGMAKAMDAHDKIMKKIQNRMNKLQNDSDVKDWNKSASKLVGIERAIQVHERRIASLNNTLENANLSEEQRINIENRIAKAQDVTANIQDIGQAKIDNIKTKLKDAANLTDEQVDKILEVMKPKLNNNMQKPQLRNGSERAPSMQDKKEERDQARPENGGERLPLGPSQGRDQVRQENRQEESPRAKEGNRPSPENQAV